MKNSQRGFATILLIIIVVVALGGAYYLYMQKTAQQIQTQPADSNIVASDKGKTIFNGAYTGYSARVKFYLKNGKTMVDGTAYWAGENAEIGQVNTGDIQGEITITKNNARYAKDGCIIDFEFVNNDRITAADNYQCGGLNVTFGGLYAKELTKKDIVGVWQNSPVMAAGWSDRYQFFQSEKYNYRRSQMMPWVRELGHSGTWNMTGGDVQIVPKYKLDIVGGAIVSDALAGKTIQGGTVVRTENPLSFLMTIAPCKSPENNYYMCRSFDGKDFYKFDSDPLYGGDSDLEIEPTF